FADRLGCPLTRCLGKQLDRAKSVLLGRERCEMQTAGHGEMRSKQWHARTPFAAAGIGVKLTTAARRPILAFVLFEFRRSSTVVDLPVWLQQVLGFVFSLITLLVVLLHWLVVVAYPLALWFTFCLLAINWKKAGPELKEGAWVPTLLLIVLIALA